MNAVLTKSKSTGKGSGPKFNIETFQALADDLKSGRIPLDRVTVSDDEQPGLRVIIRNTGLISFHVQYEVEDKKGNKARPYLKVGDIPGMSVKDARELTKTIRSLAGKGIDPVAGLHERLVRELQEKGDKWKP